MATVIRLTEALTEFSVEPNPSSVRAKLESEATLGSRLVAEGLPQAIRTDARVLEAYLGA